MRGPVIVQCSHWHATSSCVRKAPTGETYNNNNIIKVQSEIINAITDNWCGCSYVRWCVQYDLSSHAGLCEEAATLELKFVLSFRTWFLPRIHTAKEAADKSNQHCWCAAIHLTLFNNVTTRRRLIYWSSLAIACNHTVQYTGARTSWELSCAFGLATGKHCNTLDMLKRAMTRCIHPGRPTPGVWLLFSTIPTVLHSTRLRLSLLLLFAGSMQTAPKSNES